jgi:hypothetical protein
MRIDHSVSVKPEHIKTGLLIGKVDNPITQKEIVKKQICDNLLNTYISLLALKVKYAMAEKPSEYYQEISRLETLCKNLEALNTKIDNTEG